jgi:hypothetical protein
VWIFRTPPILPTQRFDIVLPESEELSNTGRHVLAVSPTGRHIVYGANNRLNLRPFDRLESTPIVGTEQGGRSPFFSPDGNWIGVSPTGHFHPLAASADGRIIAAELDNETVGGNTDIVSFRLDGKGERNRRWSRPRIARDGTACRCLQTSAGWRMRRMSLDRRRSGSNPTADRERRFACRPTADGSPCGRRTARSCTTSRAAG